MADDTQPELPRTVGEHDTTNTTEDTSTSTSTGPHSNRTGWDGKLRVNKQATLANLEALSDPDYSDDDAPPVDEIDADEGECPTRNSKRRLKLRSDPADLLDSEDPDVEASQHSLDQGLSCCAAN